MLDLLQASFFQNALFATVLSSIACGIIGSFIVVKRASFISGSISHSAFGGIGLAYYFGWNPLLGALIFSIFCSGLIGSIHHYFNAREDTLIGAVWAIGMAIGIVFIYKTPGYVADLMTYLFGNILLTSEGDLQLMVLLNGLILLVIVSLFRAFQAITYDESYAKVLNLPVFPLYLLLLAMIAITVVVLIQVVGVILVIALLSIPAATAEIFAKSLKQMIAISTFSGMLSGVLGVFLSYYLDLPSGPTIILFAFAVYLIALIFRHFKSATIRVS